MKAKPIGRAVAVKAVNPVREQISAPSPNQLIFISHDTRDAELAEAFSKLLSSVSAGMLKSFRSSDRKGTEGIEYGVEWYPEVMSKIDLASDVVCLLTPRSLERPWILYEAGVAKGKLNTPVHGVALGIPLSKAATGPFAQFQNLDDDESSLQKLVLQLMKRVPGAEPDSDTVAMQVSSFKAKAGALLESMQKQAALVSSNNPEIQESSVAKLFEEVKVMFRDLPTRIDARVARRSVGQLRSLRPEMLSELRHLRDLDMEGIEILVLTSYVKEQAPWIYEVGLETYQVLRTGNADDRLAALRRLMLIIEMSAHLPIFRGSVHTSETLYILQRELTSFVDGYISRARNDQVKRKS